jgi:hypothetical protein
VPTSSPLAASSAWIATIASPWAFTSSGAQSLIGGTPGTGGVVHQQHVLHRVLLSCRRQWRRPHEEVGAGRRSSTSCRTRMTRRPRPRTRDDRHGDQAVDSPAARGRSGRGAPGPRAGESGGPARVALPRWATAKCSVDSRRALRPPRQGRCLVAVADRPASRRPRRAWPARAHDVGNRQTGRADSDQHPGRPSVRSPRGVFVVEGPNPATVRRASGIRGIPTLSRPGATGLWPIRSCAMSFPA